MKVSLNQGAVEQKVVRGKKISTYIGNYFLEYVTKGRKEFSLKEKEELKTGELIEIPKGSTRFENFVLGQTSDIGDTDMLIHYERVKSFIISKKKKCIRKTEYDKIKGFINEFTLMYLNGSEEEKNAKKKRILKENNRNLNDYINDFALMVIYTKEMYHRSNNHEAEVEQLIGEKQKRAIRNFYAKLKNSEGLDVEKILISCNGDDNLILKDPLVVKMMLYEFAKKYYTVIERLDKNNWEDEIQWFTEQGKPGNKGYYVSKYLEAIIHVYWDFVDREDLLANNTIEEGYHLIGKFLTLSGYEEYDEEKELRKKSKKESKKGYVGPLSEKDFYDQKLKKLWEKKRTK